MDTSAVSQRLFSLFDGDSPALQFIGKWGYKAYEERELIQMYIHLLIAACFPIYIGSHASLRRPPSAEPPKKPLKTAEDDDDDDDDEIDIQPTIEGLTPSDAIMFPILAAITLSVLYIIIKFDFSALLNAVLTYYFSAIGVIGVGKLAGDGLNVATTFIFPSTWSSHKQTYHISPLTSQQVTGEVSKPGVERHREFTEKTNPLPGMLSSIKFSPSTRKSLWNIRALLKNHWIFHGYLDGIFTFKKKVQLNDTIGFMLGLAAIILYNATDKGWFLTNLMGFGAIYGVLQLMSPTTFWTGTLVLVGLFFYDIAMVFYTPMMITVAKKIDGPIKLVFPGPNRGGMLGLGDVVLPGIMMALALRFDLYLHYLRLQRPASPPATTIVASPAPSALIKAKYVEATGNWGERFWTKKGGENSIQADGGRFAKPYFKASCVGYITGMLVTLVILNVYNHAQPALLYLVPGVLISLWGTALVRGERKLMWEYTEDGSLENDGSKEKENDKKNVEAKKASNVDGVLQKQRVEEHAHHVFLFSLSKPKDARVPKKALLFTKD